MDFDVILNNYLGHFGRFQCYILMLVGISQIFGGMQINSGQFLTPNFKSDGKQQAYYSSNGSASDCALNPGSASCFQEFSEDIYDDFTLDNSTNFQIYTKKKHSMSNEIFFIGMTVGSPGFGLLADKYGRKNVMMSSTLVMLISSIGTYFSPNNGVFQFTRFITAATVTGLFQTGFILALESVGTSKRVLCANSIRIFYNCGNLILSLVASFIKKWKFLELALSVPAALLLIYFWLLPESTRWLISQHKLTKAKETILKAAKWNKVQIPDHLLQAPVYSNEPEFGVQLQRSPSPLDLVKSKVIRKWNLNMSYSWFVIAVVYYGLSMSAGNLSGNSYGNFALLAAGEMVAVFLVSFALSRCGRRRILCLTMMCGSVICFGTIFVPKGLLKSLLVILGRSVIGASFAIIFIYSSEIYPTPLRSTGLGFVCIFSQIGGLIAPFIHELKKIYSPLPMGIFSVAALISGFMSLYLPETKDQQLPNNIQDTERLPRNLSDRPERYYEGDENRPLLSPTA